MIKHQKRTYLESGINYSPKRPLVFKVIVTWTAYGWVMAWRSFHENSNYALKRKDCVTSRTINYTLQLLQFFWRFCENTSSVYHRMWQRFSHQFSAKLLQFLGLEPNLMQLSGVHILWGQYISTAFAAPSDPHMTNWEITWFRSPDFDGRTTILKAAKTKLQVWQ